ncbi:hypothetical protein MUP46_03010 [Patescibacteria group bacterium]|nr:hypothetical protein [Patescibacteria group bacterium]
MPRIFPPVNSPVQIIPGLYQSGILFNEKPIVEKSIKLLIDLDGGFDNKSLSNHLDLYVYWKIEDGPLPNLEYLSNLSSLAWWYHSRGINVLTHSQFGLNRSSLFNAMVLWKRGMRAQEIIETIKRAIPMALSNPVFKAYIQNL